MKESKKNVDYLSQWEPVRIELYKYISYFVKNEDIALDILHAATEISYKKYKGLMDSKVFKYQLLAIAKNKIFEFNRKKSKEIYFNSLTDTFLGENDLGFDSIFDKQIDWQYLLSELSDFEQQFIVLRYKETLSYKDISMILGKSEGALRTQNHRLIGKLYKLITNRCEKNT